MHHINIKPKVITRPIVYEGIEFDKCTFVDIEIDGVSTDNINEFESGVVYWKELYRSIDQSGKYLLFTCYCGIPDDAGWDYVHVEHQSDMVIWRFERDVVSEFVFQKTSYIEQVKSCEKMLDLTNYPLAIPISAEPSY